MKPAHLTAHSISRRFGRRWALRQVSLALNPGTLTVVSGHNGAGKSTFLHLLAGLTRPTEGWIELDGDDLHRHPSPATARAIIAFLGHEPFLYPELTGIENLRFMASLYGRDVREEELTKRIAEVGLTAAQLRPVATYSRGMTQRLALARILVQDASVWVLDEPSTGLDAPGRALFRQLIEAATGEGRSVVMVTHAPKSYEEIADAKVVLDNGRITSDEGLL